MKFYVACKFEDKAWALEAYKLIEEKGHEITTKWTEHVPIKPYDKNPNASAYAIEDVIGVISADYFILKSSKEYSGGKGLFVELGLAIASKLHKGKPEVYIIGDDMGKAIFYFHPVVKRRETLEEVLEECGFL